MDERMMLDAPTGVGTYAHALRRAQQTISADAGLVCDAEDPDQRRSTSFGRINRWVRATGGRVQAVRYAPGRHILPDVFRLAQVHFDIWRRPLRINLPQPAGIVHWSYPLPIEAIGWKNVYTVHDAIPLTTPALTSINHDRHLRLLRALARRATTFVTVSDTAKHEISEALDGNAPPIVNCGQALRFQSPKAGHLAAGLLPRRYLLVVGTVETRKNIPAIVDAHRLSGTELPLVIAGPLGWGSDAILPVIEQPCIIRLPYLPRDDLNRLISNAKALLMISLAEGFGLPIAEAMAAGTPVITSNKGAQAETSGNAALLVEPDQPSEIAAAIRQIINDDELSNALIQRGYNRAEFFSEEHFVQKLEGFYHSINQ